MKITCYFKKMKTSLFLMLSWPILFGCYSDDITEVPTTPSPPSFNKSDSLTMIKIYEAIGPWDSKWDYSDVTTWTGVQAALDVSTNEIRVVGFEVWNGNFHGTLPDDICKLPELRRLTIAGGSLGGHIPENIGDLKHLILLTFGNNRMSGGIPESISKLKKLQYLNITMTRMNDTLPEALGELANLEWLYISNNRFKGNVPKGIGKLTKLKQCCLNGNELSGTFPLEAVGGRTDMQIQLQNNNITELPFEIWSDDFVGIPPILQRNRLSGTVPEEVQKTKKWEKESLICTSRQQEGYGYTNVEYYY